MGYLRGRGWRIKGTQVRVQDTSKRRFTQVDVVCEDSAGVHVVIEVKTRIVTMERHQESYRKVNPEKPKAYRKPNNMYWRHQMQLKQTTEMYRKRLPKATVCAYVLVIVQDTVLAYPLAKQ